MKHHDAQMWLKKKVLRENELFLDLDDSTLETLIRYARTKLLSTGDMLYKKGEVSNGTFCAIIFGSLKVVLPGGQVIKISKSGQVMGEVAVATLQKKRSADVIATEPTSILEWTFNEIKDKVPLLERKFEKLALGHLRANQPK